MSTENQPGIVYNGLHREEFRAALQGSQASLPKYIESSIPRLHRIFATMLLMKDHLSGPTLDVASGNGVFFRVLRELMPQTLPYSVTELQREQLEIEGQTIPCYRYHCDRDRLPLEDNSLGAVLFFDVIEHLLVDPMWSLLEFNRVLKPGGHLILSTPNALGAERLVKLLQGINPGSEIEIKPTALYQRHNREWTVPELELVMGCAGFSQFTFTTHTHLLTPTERKLIASRQEFGIEQILDESFFGPEIFFTGRKREHLTVDDDLPDDIRWPAPVYSLSPGYRKRPKVFPIQVGEDYC